MMRYVIFRTDWGYCGLAGKDGLLFRSSLPLAKPAQVRAQLIKGIGQAGEDKKLFRDLQRQIQDYFKGKKLEFSTDIVISFEVHSEFTRAVLSACRELGYGRTVSYGELAKRAGRASAARAVGQVMSKNPVPLIIPCHRVIRGDGRIGGFSAKGGTSLKKRLLKLEQQNEEP